MKHLVLMLVMFTLTNCSSPVASKPDERLGTLILETTAISYSPEYRSRSRIVVSASGHIYTLITLNSGRTFGTTKTETAQTVFKKIEKDGKVTALTAPKIGSETDRTRTALRLAGDGENPYLFDAPNFSGAQSSPGVGVLVQMQLFNGTSWTPVSFLRSDLSLADHSNSWDLSNDRIRVLSGTDIVIAHNNLLSRYDGTNWQTVVMPPQATEIRLGTASATQVRAYWLTTDGTLKTDILNRDGTWVGTVASIKRGVNPTLKGVFGFAGTLDKFTLQYAAGLSVFVMKYENGTLKQVSQRMELSGELAGSSFLYATRHPTRQAFLNSTGVLDARIDGVSTGTLGIVPGWNGGAAVTCPVDCSVKTGAPVATKSECATCVPRTVRYIDFDISPNVDLLHALYVDEFQDATARFYVKSYPLPNPMTALTDPFVSGGAFPGEAGSDAGVISNDKVEISGTILVPGATAHEGTAMELKKGSTVVESVVTSSDGSFSFSPTMPGAFEVTATRTGFVTAVISILAPQPGPQLIQRVLRATSVLDSTFSKTAETSVSPTGMFQREANVLTQIGMLAPLTSALSAGDSVRLAPTLMWRESNNLCVGKCIGTLNTSTFESVRLLPGGGGLGPSIAWGVPDGVTPLTWIIRNGLQGTALLPQMAIDVAHWDSNCTSAMVFTQVAPGDIRATRSKCNTSTFMTLDLPTQSTAAISPMKRIQVLDNNNLFGFVGLSCGSENNFQAACPLQSLNKTGPVVATSISTNAIDAQLRNVSGIVKLVVMESANQQGSLKVDGTVIQSSIPLPTAYGPNETPLTVMEFTDRILVRTKTALFESNGTPGTWTQLLPNVVRVVRVPRVNLLNSRVLVWQANGTAGTCAMGCKMYVIDKLAAPVVLSINSNGNERVYEHGFFSDTTSFTCPDATACTLVQFTKFSGEVTTYGAGKLFPDVVANPKVFGSLQDVAFSNFAILNWPEAAVSLVPPNP
jgi:hypothetical protein